MDEEKVNSMLFLLLSLLGIIVRIFGKLYKSSLVKTYSRLTQRQVKAKVSR